MPVCPSCSYDHPTRVTNEHCFRCGWRPPHLDDAWWKAVRDGLRAERSGSNATGDNEPNDLTDYAEAVAGKQTMTNIKGKIARTMLTTAAGSSKPTPPVATESRSKIDQELDRMFEGVKNAAKARERWEAMKKNPQFAAALADPELGPKLQGKYEDLIIDIAEGRKS